MANTTGTAPRAALYARVSTSNHGQDVGLQLDELGLVATQRGYAAVEYVDSGVSGIKTSRPALDRMLADAQAGKLDVVMVWKLDRLGRSLQHVLCTLDALTNQGVAFISLRDAGLDSTTPAGRLFTAMIGAFAEFERDLIQERVIAGVRRAQAQGKHCGRPKRETSDKALVVARSLLDQGWGWRAIAEATGIPRDTLRRRLLEAGMLAQKPTPEHAG